MIVHGPINKKMILTIKTLNCCVKFLLSSPESYGCLVHHNTHCKLRNSFYFHLQRPELQEGTLEGILQFKFSGTEFYCSVKLLPSIVIRKALKFTDHLCVATITREIQAKLWFKHLSSLGPDKSSSHCTGLFGGKQDAVIHTLVKPCLPVDSSSSNRIRHHLLLLWWNTVVKNNSAESNLFQFIVHHSGKLGQELRARTRSQEL